MNIPIQPGSPKPIQLGMHDLKNSLSKDNLGTKKFQLLALKSFQARETLTVANALCKGLDVKSIKQLINDNRAGTNILSKIFKLFMSIFTKDPTTPIVNPELNKMIEAIKEVASARLNKKNLIHLPNGSSILQRALHPTLETDPIKLTAFCYLHNQSQNIETLTKINKLVGEILTPPKPAP